MWGGSVVATPSLDLPSSVEPIERQSVTIDHGTCQYRHSVVGANCQRKLMSGSEAFDGKCYFHKGGADPTEFADRLQKLVDANDGDWRGFSFPERMVFGPGKGEHTIPINIDARGMNAKGLIWRNITFAQTVKLDYAIVEGPSSITACAFEGDVSFRRCEFKDTFRFQSECARGIDFRSCIFRGPSVFRGQIHGRAQFFDSTFWETTDFQGFYSYDLSGAKPARISLFYGDVEFYFVTFRCPERVRFQTVDLRRAEFGTTRLDGVTFVDVEWRQKRLRRRGLMEEVRNLDDANSHLNWPRIETTYRNIRRALEDSRDFIAANDFFVGEMNARRQQYKRFQRYFLSFEAWYYALSNYGTSPGRVTLWILGALLAHWQTTVLLNDGGGKCCRFVSGGEAQNAAEHTLAMLSIWRGDDQMSLPEWWFVVDVGSQIILGILVAMLVLSLRSRVKRG